MPQVKVTVDPDLCIAAAACTGTAPKFFILDEDNRANVLGADGSAALTQILTVTDAERALLVEAAASCPTVAIVIEDVA